MRRTATGTMEWPTIALAALIYGGWLAVWHATIPTPVLVLAGAWLLACQGSLQHETIHGHPTGIRTIDDAIGFVPLALWLPYRLYRRSHLAHHGAAIITDPRHDPESRYRVPLGRLASIPARLQATLLGQMLFGPPIAVARFAIGEGARLVREPRRVLHDWTPHLVGVAILFGWLHHVGLGIGTYCACFVYPGMALTMLRSYAEHRADIASPTRAASVERGGVFALLFLNNNLHAAHHERPRLAWYALPAYHRRHRARFVGSGAPIYHSYGDVVRRFAFRPHDAIVHPGFRGAPT